MTRSQFDIAVIPGDGIGQEVTAAAVEVLNAALKKNTSNTKNSPLELNFKNYSLGAAHFHKTEEILNTNTQEKIKQADAILLGAIGDPSVRPGLLERQLLLKVRFDFDQYVNLRPSYLFDVHDSPLKDPGAIDFVVVREGTEGPYIGNGGTLRVDTDAEIATEVSINTAFGVQRLVEYGFKLAQTRSDKKLTLVHKKNVLEYAGNLWERTVDQISVNYPEVTVDYLHIDAATIFMVTDPGRFDVIVTDNLFGDIITDLAGAVTGGIGLAASANINPERTAPSMFEPVHGSAPDIAGQSKADPTAAILSAAMMCEFLSEENPQCGQIALSIRNAVSAYINDQSSERFLDKKSASTENITQAIIEKLVVRS